MITIRFLHTTPSMNPEAPFQPGQVICLDRLTPDFQRWIDLGFAEAVPATREHAVRPRGARAVH
jgi:hypothetical protein